MKNFEIKKEIWIWVIMILPLLYLAYVWPTLPDIVPTHFGMDGQPNDWSHKSVLIYIVTGTVIGVYVLLTIVPAIDPKRKISGMGSKFFLFKLFMMLFMSAISFFVIEAAVSKSIGNVHSLFVLVGALFAFLGNYMQAFKPNYFIGIRTPWTLENETIWRKTHLLGGKLFFAAGLLIMVLPFILKENFQPVFMAIVLTAAFVPIIYSFILFKREKSNSNV
jgi:uncharacterized membrane protein